MELSDSTKDILWMASDATCPSCHWISILPENEKIQASEVQWDVDDFSNGEDYSACPYCASEVEPKEAELSKDDFLYAMLEISGRLVKSDCPEAVFIEFFKRDGRSFISVEAHGYFSHQIPMGQNWDMYEAIDVLEALTDHLSFDLDYPA